MYNLGLDSRSKLITAYNTQDTYLNAQEFFVNMISGWKATMSGKGSPTLSPKIGKAQIPPPEAEA